VQVEIVGSLSQWEVNTYAVLNRVIETTTRFHGATIAAGILVKLA